MRVIIHGKDITEHINESSYKMEAEAQYKSWLDGNQNQHRIYTNDKVKGSFVVALYGKEGFTMAEFLELWESAVNNHIVIINVWVNNLNKSKTIEAYFRLTMKKSREVSDGRMVQLLNVELEEC